MRGERCRNSALPADKEFNRVKTHRTITDGLAMKPAKAVEPLILKDGGDAPIKPRTACARGICSDDRSGRTDPCGTPGAI